ncbi:MAG: hypothetical protein WBE28_01930 [bacterium]
MLVFIEQTRSISSRIFSIFLLITVVLISHGCKDPDEYNPEEPLLPPPGPPELLLPYPDTNLCHGSPHVAVFFDWTTVSGAEIYEIQTDSTLSWSTAEITRVSSPPTYIGLYRYVENAPWYARIRAGSSNWTNYTAWSQPRRFFLRPDP